MRKVAFFNVPPVSKITFGFNVMLLKKSRWRIGLYIQRHRVRTLIATPMYLVYTSMCVSLENISLCKPIISLLTFAECFIVFQCIPLSFIVSNCLSLYPIVFLCLNLSFIVSHCLSSSQIVFYCIPLSFFVSNCLSLSLIVSNCLSLSLSYCLS